MFILHSDDASDDYEEDQGDFHLVEKADGRITRNQILNSDSEGS